MLTHLSALDRVVRLNGDRPAIIDREQNFTWSEHIDRVSRIAGFLSGLNVGPGDRFGIICENAFRYTELLHAGYWGGAIPVPINHRLAPPEILHILEWHLPHFVATLVATLEPQLVTQRVGGGFNMGSHQN